MNENGSEDQSTEIDNQEADDTNTPIIWDDLQDQDELSAGEKSVLQSIDSKSCRKLREKYVPNLPENDQEFIDMFHLGPLGISIDDPSSVKAARLHIGTMVHYSKGISAIDKFANHEDRIAWRIGLSPDQRATYEGIWNQLKHNKIIDVNSSLQWLVIRAKRRDPQFHQFITEKWNYITGLSTGAENNGVPYSRLHDQKEQVRVVRRVINTVEPVFERLTGVSAQKATTRVKVT